MNKIIKATVLKDGILVKEILTFTANSEDEVLRYIKQKGLKLRTQFCYKNKEGKIINYFAD